MVFLEKIVKFLEKLVLLLKNEKQVVQKYCLDSNLCNRECVKSHCFIEALPNQTMLHTYVYHLHNVTIKMVVGLLVTGQLMIAMQYTTLPHYSIILITH